MKNEICLMVTGACNLSCPHCSQGAWRPVFRDYHMTPDEILTVQMVTGYQCGTVHIAGGEPTLWRHFTEGCFAVKASGLGRRIEVSSNCIESDVLIRAMEAGYVDSVYCQLSNASPAGVAAIKARFPNRIIVGVKRTRHKPLPTKPLDYTLPAECGCDRPAYFGGFVYQCADVFPHSMRMGYSMDTPAARWAIDLGSAVDWAAVMKGKGRHRQLVCRVCLANKKVWRRVP